jgi:AcrR family transcriptional regulator
LLDAVDRLLADHDPESLSAGTIAREAGVAYGTFYRYFSDRAHAVREALLRRGPALGDVASLVATLPGSKDEERRRVAEWVRSAAETAHREHGLVRAWHMYSNADDAVVRSRQESVEAAADGIAAYLEGLRAAGLSEIGAPRFAAYAIAALVVALGRDVAIERAIDEAKLSGLTAIALELCDLS